MRFDEDLSCFDVNPTIIGYKKSKTKISIHFCMTWVRFETSGRWSSRSPCLNLKTLKFTVVIRDFICLLHEKKLRDNTQKKKKKIVPWSQLKILKHVCLIIQVSRADKWDWATRTTGTGQRVQLGLGQRVQLGLDQRVQLGLGNEYNWDWATSTTVTTSPLIAGLPLSLGYLSLRILASCRLTHTIVGVKNPP